MKESLPRTVELADVSKTPRKPRKTSASTPAARAKKSAPQSASTPAAAAPAARVAPAPVAPAPAAPAAPKKAPRKRGSSTTPPAATPPSVAPPVAADAPEEAKVLVPAAEANKVTTPAESASVAAPEAAELVSPPEEATPAASSILEADAIIEVLAAIETAELEAPPKPVLPATAAAPAVEPAAGSRTRTHESATPVPPIERAEAAPAPQPGLPTAQATSAAPPEQALASPPITASEPPASDRPPTEDDATRPPAGRSDEPIEHDAESLDDLDEAAAAPPQGIREAPEPVAVVPQAAPAAPEPPPRKKSLLSRVGARVWSMLSNGPANNNPVVRGGDPVETLLAEVFHHFINERYRKAIAACEQVLRIDPRCAAAYNNLGAIYMKQGQLDVANEMYEKALQCDPTLPEAHENLARLASLARHRHAVKPQTIEEALQAARDLVTAQRPQEAIDVLEEMLLHLPDDVRLLNNLGVIHTRVNNLPRAETIFAHAMQIYFRESLPQDTRYHMIRENLRKVRALSGQGVSKALETTLLNEVKRRLEGGEKIQRFVSGIVRVQYATVPDDLAPWLDEGEKEADCCAVLVATTRRLHLFGQSAVTATPTRGFLRRKGPTQASFHQDIAYSSIAEVVVEGDLKRARLTVRLAHGDTAVLHAVGPREARDIQSFLQKHLTTRTVAPGADLEALPAPQFLLPRPFQAGRAAEPTGLAQRLVPPAAPSPAPEGALVVDAPTLPTASLPIELAGRAVDGPAPKAEEPQATVEGSGTQADTQ